MAYAVLYFGIGIWAIIDPVKDALELSYEIPSFMDAIGLKVSGVIGYSEVAGLYGGTTVGLANGVLLADEKKIYSADNLKVGLFK